MNKIVRKSSGSEQNSSEEFQLLLLLGSVLLIVILAPRLSTSAYYGNMNAWVSETNSCPGWGLYTYFTVSSTLTTYGFDPSNNVHYNEWEWQDNVVTATKSGWDFYQAIQRIQNGHTYSELWILSSGGGSYYTGVTGSTPNYIGSSGYQSLTGVDVNSAGKATDVVWQDYNNNNNEIINTNSLLNSTFQIAVTNYQSDFVHVPYPNLKTPVDFYSGSGQITYEYGSPNTSGCNTIQTAENSDLSYNYLNCGEFSCTQNFNAVSGYAGHSSPGTSFSVTFGNPVIKGDLLVATEATYAGGTTFGTPSDTEQNTWTKDGSLCTAYDCVAIWHAAASSTGSDTVSFTTSQATDYTYGFVREFPAYTGTVQTTSSGSGSSCSESVSSFTPHSAALVVGVVADNGGGWTPGSGYYMIAGNTGWYGATEFSPAWQGSSTTVPWTSSSCTNWAELAVSYSPP